MSNDYRLEIFWLVISVLLLALAVTGQTLIFIGLVTALVLTTRLRWKWFIYHA